MGIKSGKSGKSREFSIVEPTTRFENVDFDELPGKKRGVSISLRYFRKQTECFSVWQKGDLKKFSGLIEKIRDYDERSLKSSALCGVHKNKPSRDRFSLPDELSQDLDMYELRVDPSNKARVHGVFWAETFYLIWLDKDHQVFPS
jgi:hypothetical protein